MISRVLRLLGENGIKIAEGSGLRTDVLKRYINHTISFKFEFNFYRFLVHFYLILVFVLFMVFIKKYYHQEVLLKVT